MLKMDILKYIDISDFRRFQNSFVKILKNNTRWWSCNGPMKIDYFCNQISQNLKTLRGHESTVTLVVLCKGRIGTRNYDSFGVMLKILRGGTLSTIM